TSSDRDWSSDVCSSDLVEAPATARTWSRAPRLAVLTHRDELLAVQTERSLDRDGHAQALRRVAVTRSGLDQCDHPLARGIASDVEHVLEPLHRDADRRIEAVFAKLREGGPHLHLRGVDRDVLDRREPRQLAEHSEPDSGDEVLQRARRAPLADRRVLVALERERTGADFLAVVVDDADPRALEDPRAIGVLA